ncbi:Hypothetical predicted protein [Prunus dulcis]|uniref:Uncharacterized protein n=1 Tax=Prunus dulcis TaxID=3755 RepID=A0A5E4FVS4_PRUDU|nr:Hypothetical predicted protein [Prunus dulcis]
MALIKGEHLILYIATLERSLGALLAQHNEDDKGQALADFFAAYPTPDNMELPEDLPDEEVFTTEALTWQFYFGEATRRKGARAVWCLSHHLRA